jgi:hypothetical protein
MHKLKIGTIVKIITKQYSNGMYTNKVGKIVGYANSYDYRVELISNSFKGEHLLDSDEIKKLPKLETKNFWLYEI